MGNKDSSLYTTDNLYTIMKRYPHFYTINSKKNLHPEIRKYIKKIEYNNALTVYRDTSTGIVYIKWAFQHNLFHIP